jgi:hypothetical protein
MGEKKIKNNCRHWNRMTCPVYAIIWRTFLQESGSEFYWNRTECVVDNSAPQTVFLMTQVWWNSVLYPRPNVIIRIIFCSRQPIHWCNLREQHDRHHHLCTSFEFVSEMYGMVGKSIEIVVPNDLSFDHLFSGNIEGIYWSVPSKGSEGCCVKVYIYIYIYIYIY